MDDRKYATLLPENYIAHIISLTSPKDACRAAVVSPLFKSAVDSDVVWERFLPPDWQDILSRCTTPIPLSCSSKKDLYFLLSDSDLCLDGGKLSLRLVKSTGKKCCMLSARELGIVWKDTPDYWNWTSMPEARFTEVAELVNVCWLDICAVFQTQLLSLDTNYAAYIVFKLSDDHYGLDVCSKASIKWIGEDVVDHIEEDGRDVYIVPPLQRRVRRGRRMGPPPQATNVDDARIMRLDGWMEIKLGEFFVPEGGKSAVEIRLSETTQLRWKKGLIIQGIEVRPKEEV